MLADQALLLAVLLAVLLAAVQEAGLARTQPALGKINGVQWPYRAARVLIEFVGWKSKLRLAFRH